jgi:hypothetical protein
MPEEKIDIALDGAKKGGVTNILALRGGGFVRCRLRAAVFPILLFGGNWQTPLLERRNGKQLRVDFRVHWIL